MNFWRDAVAARPPDDRALVALEGADRRTEMTFGEVAAASAEVAGLVAAHGVRRGDVVLTLLGNRVEWVLVMLACFRQGYVVLPCNEQLRPKDLAARAATVSPALVVADRRNEAVVRAAGLDCPILWSPDELGPHPRPPRGGDSARVPGVEELGADDPCLITFTSGTSGEPKAAIHGQRYLPGQALQAEHWLAPGRGDLVWCTAASGWSKSARNAFIAPWLRGAAALLHDARFDPAERLEVCARERVDVLCMAPTEYRVIAKRAGLGPLPTVRSMVAAGEALDPEILRAWHEATGVWIRDGYGQTETGQLTGQLFGAEPRAGSMGRPLPGVDLYVDETGELVLRDPATDPTFFLRYAGEDAPAGEWRTGDRVDVDEDGFLYFSGRLDDVIISSGYRIGPFEVESALVAHAAVAEAAVVAAPDAERGAVVRAVVVLREGHAPSDALVAELQAHVRNETAPYKYPRLVEFADELPKTASGKVRRALLRDSGAPGRAG